MASWAGSEQGPCRGGEGGPGARYPRHRTLPINTGRAIWVCSSEWSTSIVFLCMVCAAPHCSARDTGSPQAQLVPLYTSRYTDAHVHMVVGLGVGGSEPRTGTIWSHCHRGTELVPPELGDVILFGILLKRPFYCTFQRPQAHGYVKNRARKQNFFVFLFFGAGSSAAKQSSAAVRSLSPIPLLADLCHLVVSWGGGRGSHTRRDKGEHSKQGGGAQQGRRGNQNSGNREPEWSGWQSVRTGGSDNKGDGLASQPRCYRVPGQPLLNRHQVGGVSRSPDGLFAQQERGPIRGRPAVRGKRTYGGRPGQRVEEQGTWASCTHKHSEAGYGRPVDTGVWAAKTVKRPRQQPAHPQYANHWAPLTRKWPIRPHPAQPWHTNDGAPRTRKRHQQEHRPKRQTESSDPTQHAKGRAGDCPGPRKETATRGNVTHGGGT